MTESDAENDTASKDAAATPVAQAAAPDGPVRAPLSSGLIVSTAVAFVEEWGLEALTMRKLGSLLGVEAMSLYRHVAGREELLDAMVDQLIDEVSRDTEVLDTAYNGWQDFIQRLAHGVRDVARRYPHTFPLVASRPPEAPWLRPPLRSVEWVEMFLGGLIEEGFSDDAAVAAYRGFSSFLLGHLLLEVSAMGADVGPLDLSTPNVDEAPGAFSLSVFPTVARLRDKLSEDQATVEFEESLENLLGRITLMRSDNPI